VKKVIDFVMTFLPFFPRITLRSST